MDQILQNLLRRPIVPYQQPFFCSQSILDDCRVPALSDRGWLQFIRSIRWVSARNKKKGQKQLIARGKKNYAYVTQRISCEARDGPAKHDQTVTSLCCTGSSLASLGAYDRLFSISCIMLSLASTLVFYLHAFTIKVMKNKRFRVLLLCLRKKSILFVVSTKFQ